MRAHAATSWCTAQGLPRRRSARSTTTRRFAMRGLVVDQRNGNLFKIDRYGHVGRALPRPAAARARAGRASSTSASASGCRTRATPGSTRCSRCPRRCCTRRSSTTSTPRRPGKPRLRARCGEDIRECIDLAHRDGSIKAIVSADLGRLHRARPEALADDAAQVPLVGEAAVPAHQLGLGLHRRGDELPARRRAAGVPVVAQLLRRHRRQRRASRSSSPSERAVRRARRATGEPTAQAVGGPAPARARLPGRQPPASSRSGPRAQRRSRALRRRSHLRRHAALEEVVDLAHGDDPAGAGARDRRCTTACAPSWRGSTASTPSCIHLDAELNERQAAMRSLQKLAATRRLATASSAAQARRQGRDREAARASCAQTAAQHRSARGRDRRRLQPVLGPALPRGQRDQQVRRAGRGLRLRLHEPRLELPLLLADAVLPRPARPHAARTLAARARRRRLAEALEQRRRFLRGAKRAGGDEVDRDADDDRHERLDRGVDGAGAGQELEPRRRHPDRRGHHARGDQDLRERHQQLARDEAADLLLEREHQDGGVDQRGDRRPQRQPDVSEAPEGQRCSRPGSRATADTLAISGTRVRPSA